MAFFENQKSPNFFAWLLPPRPKNPRKKKLPWNTDRCLHRNSSHNPAIKNAIPADHASSGHLTAIRRTPLDECDSPRTRLMPRAAPTTLFLWTSSDILAKRSQNPLKIHHSWAKFQPQTTIFGPWAQRTSGADTLESRQFFGSPTAADEGDMVFFLKSKGWIPYTPRWKPDATTCVCYSKLIPHVRKHPQKILFSKINGSWPIFWISPNCAFSEDISFDVA